MELRLNRAHNPNYRLLLEALYDAVLLCDAEGRIVEVNSRARDFFGGRGTHLENKPLGAFVSGFESEVLEQIRGHVRSGRFIVMDAQCLRTDGASFPAEIAVSRMDFEDQPMLVFSVRNISRRRQITAQLKTEHNALQNCGSAVVIADRQGLITHANPSFLRMWGFGGLEDVQGRDVRGLWGDPGSAAALVERPLAGENWEGELEALRIDGGTFHVHANAAANQDDEHIVGSVLSFVDITSRRRAERAIRLEAAAQLQQARRRKDFAGLLHIISLSDVFQLIAATRKSGTLAIMDESGAESGLVGFEQGQVTGACRGNLAGEAAVFALLKYGGVSFQFRQGTTDLRHDDIRHSTTGLLLEGARLADEQQAAKE